jgi:hypothetical protein
MANPDPTYIAKLENVIKQMLQPLRDIPFRLVINALSGTSVIAIDRSSPKDKELIASLSKVAETAGKAVNQIGITRTRANEVGNDIEEFVKTALNTAGFTASVPHTKSGKLKTTGYPDVEFKDKTGRTVYIECKTYNNDNIATTFRSFYLSPSDDFKVTKDGLHIGLSYQVVVTGKQGADNIYKVRHWMLIDLEKLEVDVKYEFNSDNKRLYTKANILAEGSI